MAQSTSSAVPPPWRWRHAAMASSRASAAGPATRAGSGDQVAGVEQGGGDQVGRVSRASRVTGGRVGQQLEGTAQPAQAQGVGAAERAAEQLGGGLLVQRRRAQRAAQQHEQRPGARLVRQRQLVARPR